MAIADTALRSDGDATGRPRVIGQGDPEAVPAADDRSVGPVRAPLRVLVVCTGNVARSPMAEVLLQRQLQDAGLAADVSSAGLWRDGEPAAPEARHVVRQRGGTLEAHRSRKLRSELLDVDLVLTMERRHVRAVTVMDRRAFPRCFTLKELARRVAAVGPRRPGEDVAAWLARVGAGREPMQLLGVDRRDEVADPLGGGRSAFESTADEIEHSLRVIVDGLTGD